MISIPFSKPVTNSILCILFFFSGCAALIYQIMWQRMLFTQFGVDLESITIIVSVFMFGLGMGGIGGGIIADRMPTQLLSLYIMIELGIAIFGFLSPTIIQSIGDLTITSMLLTCIVSFIILVIPTFLMGATFPILVSHVFQYDSHIGRSVGRLYFANTLGGAFGAYLSGFVLLYFLNLIESINCAAILNLFIAWTAWIIFRRK